MTTKKALLAIAFTAVASAAHADWARIDAPFPDLKLYIDHESIKKSSPGRLQVYHIIDYAQPQQKDGKDFRSEMFRYEYDCEKSEYREMGHTWHKGTMAGDKMIYFTEGAWAWTKPESGSVEDVLLKASCAH